MTIRIVESREVERDYGFRGVDAIVEHPKHGRLMLCDGYGGVDTLSGGAVRWRHGAVYTLQPADTFAALDAPYNDTTTVLQAMRAGYGDRAPLDWDGAAIEGMAEAAGL